MVIKTSTRPKTKKADQTSNQTPLSVAWAPPFSDQRRGVKKRYLSLFKPAGGLDTSGFAVLYWLT
jgi:hypothetical protein